MTTPAAIEKFTARREVLRQERDAARDRLDAYFAGPRDNREECQTAVRAWTEASAAFHNYDRVLSDLIRRNAR